MDYCFRIGNVLWSTKFGFKKKRDIFGQAPLNYVFSLACIFFFHRFNTLSINSFERFSFFLFFSPKLCPVGKYNNKRIARCISQLICSGRTSSSSSHVKTRARARTQLLLLLPQRARSSSQAPSWLLSGSCNLAFVAEGSVADLPEFLSSRKAGTSQKRLVWVCVKSNQPIYSSWPIERDCAFGGRGKYFFKGKERRDFWTTTKYYS